MNPSKVSFVEIKIKTCSVHRLVIAYHSLCKLYLFLEKKNTKNIKKKKNL